MRDRENGEDLFQLLQSPEMQGNATVTRLYQAVEGELRRLARSLRAQRAPDPTMQTTLLVNEVFMRLIANHNKSWEDRDTFFRVAYGTMRNILADHGRRRRPKQFAPGEAAALVAHSPEPEREAEDSELFATFADAMRQLQGQDQEAAAVFLLCFFNTVDSEIALTDEELQSFSGERKPLAELAAAKGCSVSGVHRVLGRALAFLQTQLSGHH